MISAYIGNLGKYNEGILAVEPLRFPASTEEVYGMRKSLLPIMKLMLPGCGTIWEKAKVLTN